MLIWLAPRHRRLLLVRNPHLDVVERFGAGGDLAISAIAWWTPSAAECWPFPPRKSTGNPRS